jgi:hypothetical protein
MLWSEYEHELRRERFVGCERRAVHATPPVRRRLANSALQVLFYA